MNDNMHWREKNIIDALGGGKLKTSDIIGRVNMCKVTALKYLYRLMRRGIVEYEKIGPTKLWYVSGNNPDREREKSDGRVLDLDKLYGEKAKIVFTSNGITLTMEGKIVNKSYNEHPPNMVR
ncbi:MAG: hypothetical protein A7315_10155 [Candidatus Altiarchaeales archaeon WOR_SM1_79]|nr:MAG: hypothetical protein A7315_10155 [Candidatus Altiarchaeales archaeon WOR_SM1_79]